MEVFSRVWVFILFVLPFVLLYVLLYVLLFVLSGGQLE
jgi:hypothetical protein